MDQPKVSLIIPVKPGGTVRALAAVRQVDYPAAAYEVLVAEGRCPSRQRNLAAAEAGGELLYFLDDDSLTDPGFLRRAVGHFGDQTVAAVGGPSLTPAGDSVLQQAFGLALASPFGGGSVRNRYRKSGTVRKTGDHELILCNLCFSAEAFRAAGGFDERLYPNEENELLVRLQRCGRVLLHDPDLAVVRSQRQTLRAFIRQLFGYGSGRAKQILLGGGWGGATLVPPLFLMYLLTLPLVRQPVYSLPLLWYLGLAVMFSLAALGSIPGRRRSALLLPLLFPVLHLVYGAGLLAGLVVHGLGRQRTPGGTVAVKRLKTFAQGSDW